MNLTKFTFNMPGPKPILGFYFAGATLTVVFFMKCSVLYNIAANVAAACTLGLDRSSIKHSSHENETNKGKHEKQLLEREPPTW